MWSGFKEDLCTFQHELYAYRVNKSALSVTLNSCFKNTSGIWSLIQNTRTTKNHNFCEKLLNISFSFLFTEYNIIYNTIDIIINNKIKFNKMFLRILIELKLHYFIIENLLKKETILLKRRKPIISMRYRI